jgi:predicted transcriptional regulator
MSAEVQKVAEADDRYPAEIIRYAVREYLDRRKAAEVME